MKINLVLPTLAHSGGVQMALEYMNYFVENDNDVVCYVPLTGPYYGARRILFLRTIIHVCISKKFFKNIRGKWFDNKFKIKFVPSISDSSLRNADVTIATSWVTSYWVVNLNKNKGVKVYFIQDYETWGNAKENELVKKSYVLPFDLRITVSTSLHNKLWRDFKSNSKVLPNGIKEEYIRKSKKNFQKLIVGFPYRKVRGKEDIKNSSFAIKALSDFQKKENIKIKAFGFEKPKNWNNKIDFLEDPTRKQLFAWYDGIDIFYVPSLYEGWGLPAMEAMARGCVVIAADTGCIYEYGQHMVNCYKLQNMRSKEELYTALKYFLTIDETVMQRISQNAIKTISKYSFEKEGRKFLSFLDDAVNSSSVG